MLSSISGETLRSSARRNFLSAEGFSCGWLFPDGLCVPRSFATLVVQDLVLSEGFSW